MGKAAVEATVSQGGELKGVGVADEVLVRRLGVSAADGSVEASAEMAREVEAKEASYLGGDEGDEGVEEEEEDDEAFEGGTDKAGRDATEVLADYVDGVGGVGGGHGCGGGGGGV